MKGFKVYKVEYFHGDWNDSPNSLLSEPMVLLRWFSSDKEAARYMVRQRREYGKARVDYHELRVDFVPTKKKELIEFLNVMARVDPGDIPIDHPLTEEED